MKIKPSQIYSWEEEPVDERPSEFSSTTGHSMLSGYHPMNDPAGPPRSRSRFGFKSMLAFCAVILALGVIALMQIAPLLRS